MISLAVAVPRGRPTRTTTAAASRSTSATTSGTSSSTSTRTSTRCRSGSCAGSSSSARTCASSATTTRRSTSGAAARSRTSSRSPTATTASARSRSPTTSARARASSSSAGRSPSGSRPAAAAEGDGRGRAPDVGARRPARARVRRPGRRGGVDLRPHRGTCAASPFSDGPDAEPRGLSWSDCAVLFRSVAKDSGPARRRAAAPRHPVRRQGPEPAVRQPRDPGRRRHVPLHGRRDRRRRCCERCGTTRSCSRPAPTGRRRLPSWTTAATSTRGKRWRVYNIQRLYLDFLEALGVREDTLPGDPTRARARLLPARQVQPGDLGLRADLLQDRRRRRSTRRSRTGSSTRRPTTTPSRTPTSGYATPDAVTHRDRAPGQGDAVAGSVPARAAQQPVPVERRWAACTLPRHPGDGDRRPRPLPRHGRGRDAAVLRRRDARAEVPVRDVLAGRRQPAATNAVRRSSTTSPQQQWFSTATGVPIAGRPARRRSPPRDAAGHALVLGAEVPVRVPVPVQAAVPVRLQPADPRGARLRQGPARRAGRDAQAGARRRHRHEGRRPRSSSTGTCTRRSRTRRCASSCAKRRVKAVERYFDAHGNEICATPSTPRSRSRSTSRPGITVDGRIDLIRRLDTTSWRSSTSSRPSALRPRTSRATSCTSTPSATRSSPAKSADLIEVLNLDEKGKTTRESVSEPLLGAVRDKIRGAGESLRANDLPRLEKWCGTCGTCDLVGLCRERPKD